MRRLVAAMRGDDVQPFWPVLIALGLFFYGVYAGVLWTVMRYENAKLKKGYYTSGEPVVLMPKMPKSGLPLPRPGQIRCKPVPGGRDLPTDMIIPWAQVVERP